MQATQLCGVPCAGANISSVPSEGIGLKLNRFSAALGILVTGVLLFSACSSHNNAAGGGPSTSAVPVKVTCGGKPALKASGSTAQKNAMSEFVKNFAQLPGPVAGLHGR